MITDDDAVSDAPYLTWLRSILPSTYSGPLAPYHHDFWRHVWRLRKGEPSQPFIAIWPRGWAKSTNGEVAAIRLALSGYRYCLYVSGTQAQADKHVLNLSLRLTSPILKRRYPYLSQSRIQQVTGQQGSEYPHGWERRANEGTGPERGEGQAAKGGRFPPDGVGPDGVVPDSGNPSPSGPSLMSGGGRLTSALRNGALGKAIAPASERQRSLSSLMNAFIPPHDSDSTKGGPRGEGTVTRGRQLGWRRNRIWTADGFVVDALGLDTAIRGALLEDNRPDLIILDDIDAALDTPEAIARKEDVITRDILLAAAPNACVLVLQNIIHRYGIVARLSRLTGPDAAPYLANRIISGPWLAINDLVTEGQGTDARIISGTPTWEVKGIAECQSLIETAGLPAFLAECQHEVAQVGSPRFSLEALAAMRSRMLPPIPQNMIPPAFRSIEGFRIYALPSPGTAYVQYTDPAEGKGRDYTATVWMEARTRTVVAILEDNDREPTRHADLAVDIGEWYNSPLTGYERARGESIALVFGRRGVRRIYEHVDNPLTPQEILLRRKEKRIPGFPMTRASKVALIDRLAAAIASLSTHTSDERMLTQATQFVVTPSMRLAAEGGGHDDLVLAWAGCLLLAASAGAFTLSGQSATAGAGGGGASNVRGYTPGTTPSGLFLPGAGGSPGGSNVRRY